MKIKNRKKIFIFVLLLSLCFITLFSFNSKAYSYTYIESLGYTPVVNDYIGLSFGTDITNNVYINTDNGFYIDNATFPEGLNGYPPTEVDKLLNMEFYYEGIEYNAIHIVRSWNDGVGDEQISIQFYDTYLSNLSEPIYFGFSLEIETRPDAFIVPATNTFIANSLLSFDDTQELIFADNTLQPNNWILSSWCVKLLTNVPVVPDLPDTDKISILGEYRFNTQVSLDIFDLEESETELLFPGYFHLADGTGTNYNRIYCSLNDSIGDYLAFDNISISDSILPVGEINTEKTLSSVYSSRRLIYFDNQTIDIDIYNWLIENGQFGNFDEPLPDFDNPFMWLIDNVNDFLHIEILPGLSFINILYLTVSIPLAIYILKLFLGG